MSNSIDPDEMAHSAFSSGSMLFAKVKEVAVKELKVQSKIVADNILIFYNYYFFCENKTWHFLQIVC